MAVAGEYTLYGQVDMAEVCAHMHTHAHTCTHTHKHAHTLIHAHTCNTQALLPGPELWYDRLVSSDDLERANGRHGKRESHRGCTEVGRG